jgi:molybdopterin converting factor small subunit
MQIKCLLFGEVRAMANADFIILEGFDLSRGDGVNSNDILAKLTQVLPQEAKGLVTASALAVNCEYIPLEGPVVVNPNDEVALIPPVSGG